MCVPLYFLIWVSDLYFTILFVVRSDWVVKIFLFPFLVHYHALSLSFFVSFFWFSSYIYVRRTFVFGVFTIRLGLGLGNYLQYGSDVFVKFFLFPFLVNYLALWLFFSFLLLIYIYYVRRAFVSWTFTIGLELGHLR